MMVYKGDATDLSDMTQEEAQAVMARRLLINPGRVGVFAFVAVSCETARHARFE
jgi:hypothetical protein